MRLKVQVFEKQTLEKWSGTELWTQYYNISTQTARAWLFKRTAHPNKKNQIESNLIYVVVVFYNIFSGDGAGGGSSSVFNVSQPTGPAHCETEERINGE